MGTPNFYRAPKHSFVNAVHVMANPSVRLSVTLRYFVKKRERRGMRSSSSGSSMSVVYAKNG